jgi:hypothetical protein
MLFRCSEIKMWMYILVEIATRHGCMTVPLMLYDLLLNTKSLIIVRCLKVAISRALRSWLITIGWGT